MTTITADRAFVRSNEQTSRSTFRTVTLAIATPVLAVALSWGLVDACAYTQHSLLGVYTVSSTSS
jgi:hypothetical protein